MLPLLLLLACDPSKPTDTGTEPPDHDGDGFSVLSDCDDGDAEVFPGASEDPYDGLDNDCDPGTPDDDLDGDGAVIDVDCDDGDDQIGPGAEERCNGLDDDCDGETDDDAYDSTITEICGNGQDDNCDGTGDDCELEGEHSLDDADAYFLGERSYDFTATGSAPTDLDGDGYGDIVAARCGDDDCTGVFDVFPGPLEGELAEADAFVTVTGEEENGGYAWTQIGDMDGDGSADLVFTAGASPGGALIRVLSGPFTSGDYTTADADIELMTDESELGSGSAVSMRLGDLDGDGQLDLMATQLWMDPDTYAYYGPGELTVTLGPLEAGSAPIEEAEVVITGEEGEQPWWEGRFAGDLNGDGIEDLAIGAEDSNDGAGYVYLLLGPVSSGAAADADLRLEGDEAGDALGRAIEPAGDSNDDGLGDLWIAAAYADTNGRDSGDARLFTGSASGLDTAPTAAVLGQEGRRVSALASGELNGDGSRDVAIGDLANDNPGTVALFYGPFSGTRAVEDADARFVGSETADCFGAYYLYAGDHNGDGVDDIVTSAFALDGYRGGVFVFTSLGM